MALQDTLEKVLALSTADSCIAIAWHHSSANLRWALNTTTTNGVTDSQELLVISVIDGRVGSVGRSYFPDESLEAIVRESEKACAGKPPAEDLMPLLEDDGVPAGWDNPPETTGIEVFAKLAPDLAAAFGRAREGGYLLFGFAEFEQSTTYLATSTGLRRRHSGAEGKFQINAKTPDFKTSAWAGVVTTTFDDVDLTRDGAQAGRAPGVVEELDITARRALRSTPGAVLRGRPDPGGVLEQCGKGRRRGAKRLQPGGRRQPAGRNSRLEGVTVYSDPVEPGFEVSPFVVAPSSSSYSSVFDNGMSTSRVDWITRGELSGLITTRHWAKVSGQEPKPFIDNLIFPAAGPSLEEMIASTRRGLLVTCLWYIREVDPQTLLLTGLTRDGVFLVEDGKVTGAVNNFRFNMSPLDMLAQTTEIGESGSTLARELGDYFTFAKMPPLRVRDFNMSSVSESV